MKKYGFFSISLLLMLSFKSFGQDKKAHIEGRVLHSETKEPIPFVHVFLKDKEKQGVVTDIRGEFKLPVSVEGDTLIFSHVSFEKYIVPYSEINKRSQILLKPKQLEMAEVVFSAGENPALPIMRRAIDNKNKHDTKNLDSYKFNSYNKLIFSLKGLDENVSVPLRIDSVLNGGHLFISESYSEIRYQRPGKKNEVVKASKMSGIESPMIAVVSSSIQPFSFMDDHISIFEMPYVNPLSKDGLRRYDYFLEDSIQSQKYTSYIISFQPQKGKTYLLGKGLLTISSMGFALENIVFKSTNEQSTIPFELQQQNTWNGEHWFPYQINSKYAFPDIDLEGIPLKLINQNYISDVVINSQEIKKTIKPIALVFDIQNDLFPMEEFRLDTLSEAERSTYKRFEELDSRTLRFLNTFSKIVTQLSTGKIPLGKVDILPNRFLRINQFEGLALGLGLSSNQTLSDIFRVEGYFRYGLRDRGWKYGTGIETMLQDARESKLMVYYSNEIAEIGTLPYLKTNSYSSTSDAFRAFLSERMDRVERASFEFSQIPRQNWRIALTGSFEDRTSLWLDQLEFPVEQMNNSFQAAELGLNFRYISKEYTSKIGTHILSGPASYPIFHFNISRAIPDVFGSDVDFWRLGIKFQHQWKKGVSLNQFMISGFGVWGETVPLSYLNTGFGIRPQERNLSITIPGYLQTMRIYEFFSDQAISATYTHLTGPLFDYKMGWASINPQLSLNQSFAIGTFDDDSLSEVVGFQTLEKGYFESGLELQNLIKYKSSFGFQGIGIGVFYRWGAYSNPSTSDNILINFSLKGSF